MLVKIAHRKAGVVFRKVRYIEVEPTPKLATKRFRRVRLGPSNLSQFGTDLVSLFESESAPMHVTDLYTNDRQKPRLDSGKGKEKGKE